MLGDRNLIYVPYAKRIEKHNFMFLHVPLDVQVDFAENKILLFLIDLNNNLPILLFPIVSCWHYPITVSFRSETLCQFTLKMKITYLLFISKISSVSTILILVVSRKNEKCCRISTSSIYILKNDSPLMIGLNDGFFSSISV